VKSNQMVGVVALVLGVVLLGSAFQATTAPLHQISSAVAGGYVNQIMAYLLAGMGVGLSGGLLAVFGRRL
jgi:hypothetical protein